jgi:soluble lytic murein transglycosylase-like protein
MATVKTKYGAIDSRISKYLPIIEKYSKQYKVPVMIIVNTIYTESRGNPKAWNGQNNENSRGLMQISERTAQSPPLNIPFMLLDTLYDPDTNIKTGTKYLAYLRDFLIPYFDKSATTKVKWTVITSSYNQGHGYYKKALIYISQMGKSQTWENIEYRVLNPVGSTRKPWTQNVHEYGPGITGQLKTRQLSTGVGYKVALAVAVTAFIGGVGYYAWVELEKGKSSPVQSQVAA